MEGLRQSGNFTGSGPTPGQISDSGAEALSPSVGGSLAWPGLLKGHGAWSSEMLRGLVRLQGLVDPACMTHV